MKKLILVVAIIFLLLTYGNYRKQQILSRAQNYKPNPTPKISRALTYEEMAARKRAEEAEKIYEESKSTNPNDSTLIDSINPEIVPEDSIITDTLNIKIENDTI